LLTSTDVEDHYRFVECARLASERFKGGNRIKTLDVNAERGDARVFQQVKREFGNSDQSLVADGKHVGQRQAALLHGEVDRDVGGLRDDGHARLIGFETLAALLIGPQ